MFRAHAFEATSLDDIRAGIEQAFSEAFADCLPEDKGARVLLKPNLNAHMNALTGNTTDLRLLSAVVESLKRRGYTDITLGEGTNSGYYRNNISVISRLRVDALARRLDVKVKDLNRAEPAEIPFEDGVVAQAARDGVDADFLINMPKLKTHFEAGMSVCLKNLMGCLIGQENKKKTHRALAANILNINRRVQPHLHIVDALIAMEGLGPTRGTPIRTNTVFMGTDPYVLDLLCARFASFPWAHVRPLAEAKRRGLIQEGHLAFVEAFPLARTHAFKPPKAGPLASFVHSPKRQKYFLAVRNTPLFNRLCSTQWVGKLLFMTGLRQDVFREDEMSVTGFSVDAKACTRCGKCAAYCPEGRRLPEELPDRGGVCLDCAYCFCVCPQKCIAIRGEMGFMQEQLKQYDEIVRRIA